MNVRHLITLTGVLLALTVSALVALVPHYAPVPRPCIRYRHVYKPVGNTYIILGSDCIKRVPETIE